MWSPNRSKSPIRQFTSPARAQSQPAYMARWAGTCWESAFHPNVEIARQAQAFREGRSRSKGLQDAEFSVIAFVHCARTDAEADARIGPYHKWFYTTMGKSYGMDKDPNPANLAARYIRNELRFEDLKRGGMIISGSPDTCIKVLQGMESAGVDRAMCQFRLGLMPHREVMESLALFSKEVVPALI